MLDYYMTRILFLVYQNMTSCLFFSLKKYFCPSEPTVSLPSIYDVRFPYSTLFYWAVGNKAQLKNGKIPNTAVATASDGKDMVFQNNSGDVSYHCDMSSLSNGKDCATDFSKCTVGVSFSMWIRLDPMEITSNDPLYLFENNAIWAYIQNAEVNIKCIDDGKLYHVKWSIMFDQIYTRKPVNIAVRYNKKYGLGLLLNGNPLINDTTGVTYSSSPSDDVFTIGARKTGSNTFANFIKKSHIEDLGVWKYYMPYYRIILLLGGQQYRLIDPPTTTATTLKPVYHIYSSNIKNCTFQTSNRENPYYATAHKYFNLLNPSLWKSNIALTMGRNFKNTSAILIEQKNSYIELEKADSANCFNNPNECSTGFAVSIWLFIPKKIDATADPSYIVQAGYATPSAGYVIQWLKAKNSLKIIVILNAGRELEIPQSSFKRDIWFNLAFSYNKKDAKLYAYINSVKLNIPGSTVANPTQGNGGTAQKTVNIGGRGFRNDDSAASISVSDFIFWDRFIYEFEANKFIGVSQYTQNALVNANAFWSPDQFVADTHMTKPIYCAANTTSVFVSGVDSLSQAISVAPNVDGWVMLAPGGQPFNPTIGDTYSCISNPVFCTKGLTVSTYFKLTSYPGLGENYVITSGVQDPNSRGMGFFFNNDRMFISIANGVKLWGTTLDKSKLPLNKWMNMVFSWSKDKGFWLAVDGKLTAVNEDGNSQFIWDDRYKKVMVGRLNTDSFTSPFMSVIFASMQWRDAYYDVYDFLQPLGLIDYRYASAEYFWNKDRLIGSTIDLVLSTKANGGTPPGPVGLVEASQYWTTMKVAQIAKTAKIILGTLTADRCISDISKCSEKGFSMSLYGRLNNVDVDVPILRAKGSGETPLEIRIKNSLVVITLKSVNLTATSKSQVKSGVWFNIAFTYSESEGLAMYVSGKLQIIKPETITYAAATKCELYAGIDQSDSITNYELDLYNVAAWEHIIYSSHTGNLMGMETTSTPFFRATTYWPFDGPAQHMFSPQVDLSGGAVYVQDRTLTGRAIQTDKAKKQWASLGDHSGGCIIDPGLCVNAIYLNMKLKLSLGNGTVLSAGAETDGQRGTWIEQINNKLKVVIANGVEVWTKTTDVPMGKWFLFGIKWTNSQIGLILSVDGQDKTLAMGTTVKENRTAVGTPNVTLAKSNSADKGYLSAIYDDITFYYYRTINDTPEGFVVFDSCYETSEQTFFIYEGDGLKGANTKNVRDRFNKTNAARQTESQGYIRIGDFKGRCLSDPGKCTEGITLSFYVYILTSPQGSKRQYLFGSGYQSGRGISVTINEGTENSCAIQVNVHNGDLLWTQSIDAVEIKEWVNIGLTWEKTTGLRVFLHGKLNASTDTSKASGNYPKDYFTLATLGRPNYGMEDFANAIFDDFALWSKALPLDTPNLSGILRGKCGPPVDMVTGNDFTLPPTTLYPPTTTPKPTPPFVPYFPCNGAWRNQICVSTDQNALANMAKEIGNSSKPLTVEQANTIMDVITNTANAGSMNGPATKGAAILVQKCTKTVPPTPTANDSRNAITKMCTTISSVISQDWGQVSNPGQIAAALPDDNMGYILKVAENFTINECDSIDVDTSKIVASVIKMIPGKCAQPIHFPGPNDTRAQNKKITDYIQIPPQAVPGGHGEVAVTYTDGGFSAYMDATIDPASLSINNTKFMVNSPIFTVATNPPLTKKLNGTKIRFCLSLRVPNQLKPQKRKQKVKYKYPYSQETACGFINQKRSKQLKSIVWDTEGCVRVETNLTHTICECDHMTSFAILMQPFPVEVDDGNALALSILTYIGILVSLFCLVLFLVVIIKHKHLHSERHLIHANLIIAMIFASLFFMFGRAAINNRGACQALSILMHYFFTASFCWMWIEGLYIFYAITSGVLKGRLKCYIPFAWGVPLIIVIACIAIDIDAYGWPPVCFITSEDNAIYAFIGPVLLFIFLDLCVLCIVICNITTPAIKREDVILDLRKALTNSIMLVPVLGITWLFGLFSAWDPSYALQYIFVILASLQGLFIFLFYCVGSRDTRAILRRWFCCGKGDDDHDSNEGSTFIDRMSPRGSEISLSHSYSETAAGTSSEYIPVKPQPRSRPTTPRTRHHSTPPPVYVP